MAQEGSPDLSGRVALVTGGGSGIGAGAAEALADSGAQVVLVGRRAERLARVAGELAARGHRVHTLAFDIGRGDGAAELVARAVELAGHVDVLVHAAGNQVRSPALDLDLADFDAVIDLHLRAAFALAQAVGRHLVATDRPGSLVFVGSMTSLRVGLANTVAYAAAKSGLLGLVRTLAVEWAPHEIRTNAVLVGFVKTELTRDVDDTPGRIAVTSRVPLGRHGSSREIGDAIAFLASNAASYVTGTYLTVDGGWSVA
jgi:NAD(P)-dependent dehydrogenase (short-subunit alcohol dehydrogenase family)